MTNSVCNSGPDSTRRLGPATDRYKDPVLVSQSVQADAWVASVVRSPFGRSCRTAGRNRCETRRPPCRAEPISRLRHNYCVVDLAARETQVVERFAGIVAAATVRQDGARQNFAVACEPDRSYAPYREEAESQPPICSPRVAFTFRRRGSQVSSGRTSGGRVERVAWNGLRRCRPRRPASDAGPARAWCEACRDPCLQPSGVSARRCWTSSSESRSATASS